MSTEQGFVGFQISGADFTRLARERVLDDCPDHAYRIASCLLSDDEPNDRQVGVADAALGILNGTKKLVGDTTNMRIVKEAPEVTKTYLKQVQYVYAGRIRIQGQWYQPVAYVSNMGREDMRNAHGMPVYRLTNNRGYANRAWHYCGKNEIVVEHACFPDPETYGLAREVIFERCSERPHWLNAVVSPQEALDEFLAAGKRLEERSHSQWYGADGVILQPSTIDSANLTTEAVIAHESNNLREDALLAHEIEDRNAREEAEEAIEKEAEALRQRKLAHYREQILTQANGDVIELVYEATKNEYTEEIMPGGKLIIPRAPFLHWAFARMKMFEEQLPPWTNVCPTGMKMALDDQNHTDWIVGAGLDPQDRDVIYSPGPVNEAALRKASELQDQFDRPKAITVLVDGPWASGTVVHGKPNQEVPDGVVVVLPNLHPRYLACTVHAAAVITEAGGETAHLAQIGREKNLPIVRIENAREKYPEGITVIVNTAGREVHEV